MRFPLRYFLGLIAALLLWGFSFPILKIALQTNGPASILMYRYLLALGLLLPWFFRKRAGWTNLLKNPALLLIGLANWAGSILQFMGLRWTSSTKSAILTQLMIVAVPIMARWVLGEHLNRTRVYAIILSLTGAVILSTNLEFQEFYAGASMWGDVLTITAVLFWGIFIVYTRKFAQKVDGFWILAPNYLVTAALAVPTALLSGQTELDRTGWYCCLFLAVFCTLLPTMLYNFALKRVDATSSAILGPLETLSAGYLSFLLLGEALTWMGSLGALLILSSTYLVEKE